jgi:hypothetical protein
LRFERVTMPTDGFNRLYGDLQTAAESLHQDRVMPAAAGNQPLPRRRRKMAHRRRDRRRRHLGQGGRAVFE